MKYIVYLYMMSLMRNYFIHIHVYCYDIIKKIGNF